MKVIKSEFVGTDANGKDWWRVIIVNNESVDTPPTTGSGVDGLPDEAGIAAGSVLLTPDGNTVYYTDSMGGGGGGDLVSVTLSPPIPADQELSSFFPINYDSLTPEEKMDGKTIYLVPDQALTEGDEYSYTITPGADWYVNKGGHTFGGQGEAVTLTATVELLDGNPILEFRAGIVNEPSIPADKVLDVTIVYENLV